MTTVLLDTNIVSYLFKRDSRAAQYAPHLLDRELTIAIMTVAELFQWAAIRNWGEPRIRRLEQLLERYTILPVDVDLCRQWPQSALCGAELVSRSRRKMRGSPQQRSAIDWRSSRIIPMTIKASQI